MDSRVKPRRRIAISIPKLDEKDLEAIRGILVNVTVYAAIALVIAIVAGTAVGIFVFLVRTIGGF